MKTRKLTFAALVACASLVAVPALADSHEGAAKSECHCTGGKKCECSGEKGCSCKKGKGEKAEAKPAEKAEAKPTK